MALYCSPIVDMNYLFWITAAIMISAVAVLFMIGRGLQRKEYEMLAREEFRQVIISLVMGLALVALASSFCFSLDKMMVKVSPGTSLTHFQYAENYLIVMINNFGIPLIKKLWATSFFATSLSLQGPVEYSGTNPLDGASLIGSAADKITSYIFVPLVSSLNIQLIVLQAAEAFSFTLLLPCGILLRALRPTRAAGCFLIAIAFAGYVVYPLTYIINYQITQSIFPEFEKATLGDLVVSELVSDPIHLHEKLIGIVLGFIDQGAILFPQAVLFPLLGFAITVSFINTFSDFIKDLK